MSMAYSFRPNDHDISAALRRVARDRLDHALQSFDKEPPDEALHTARKDVQGRASWRRTAEYGCYVN
jgi:hypothetical protein